MKLKYIYARLNIASILLNAVVAVFKLSHMLCFVQTAFSVWVCTVTHHDKWNVFLLLTVLFVIACFCVIMQNMLLCCVILWRNCKECCLFGCDTLLVGRNLPTYMRKFCCTNIIVILGWEQLASSKSSLLFIRLHSAISYKTLFLIATASRVLHVYTVCCRFSHHKVL